MTEDYRRDYGPAGCAGRSTSLLAVLALLACLVKRGKR